MKKIILFVFLFFSFLSINYSFADESEKDEAKAKYIDDCKVSKNCIDQPSFVIKT
jgi:hypothetical protein